MAQISRLKDAEIESGNIIIANDLDAEFDGIINESNGQDTRIDNIESNALTIGGLKTFTDGIATDTIAEKTGGSGVTVDGLLIKDATISLTSLAVNTINEFTTANGVVIDSVTCKDGMVTVAGTPASDGEIGYVSNLFKAQRNSVVETMAMQSDVVFGSEYVSTAQTITAAALLSLTHGLGAEPEHVAGYIVNITPDLGYTTGMTVPIALGGLDNALNRGLGIQKNATTIEVRIGSDANSLQAINYTTGATSGITNASWSLVMKGWL